MSRTEWCRNFSVTAQSANSFWKGSQINTYLFFAVPFFGGLLGVFTLTTSAVTSRNDGGMCASPSRLLRSSLGRQSIAFAKKSGPSLGMSEKSISESFMASTRFQSVLDGLFICCVFVLVCIIQGYLMPPTPLKVQMPTANC